MIIWTQYSKDVWSGKIDNELCYTIIHSSFLYGGIKKFSVYQLLDTFPNNYLGDFDFFDDAINFCNKLEKEN